MVLGKKVAIFDLEWGQKSGKNRPLEKGRKSPVINRRFSLDPLCPKFNLNWANISNRV